MQAAAYVFCIAPAYLIHTCNNTILLFIFWSGLLLRTAVFFP
jgi:hypothetical protein